MTFDAVLSAGSKMISALDVAYGVWNTSFPVYGSVVGIEFHCGFESGGKVKA
jgi:hypothetical protein